MPSCSCRRKRRTELEGSGSQPKRNASRLTQEEALAIPDPTTSLCTKAFAWVSSFLGVWYLTNIVFRAQIALQQAITQCIFLLIVPPRAHHCCKIVPLPLLYARKRGKRDGTKKRTFQMWSSCLQQYSKKTDSCTNFATHAAPDPLFAYNATSCEA